MAGFTVAVMGMIRSLVQAHLANQTCLLPGGECFCLQGDPFSKVIAASMPRSGTTDFKNIISPLKLSLVIIALDVCLVNLSTPFKLMHALR